jgi:hypothetical protein
MERHAIHAIIQGERIPVTELPGRRGVDVAGGFRRELFGAARGVAGAAVIGVAIIALLARLAVDVPITAPGGLACVQAVILVARVTVIAELSSLDPAIAAPHAFNPAVGAAPVTILVVAVITYLAGILAAVATSLVGQAIRAASITIDAVAVIALLAPGKITVLIAAGLVRTAVPAAPITTEIVAVIALLTFVSVRVSVAAELRGLAVRAAPILAAGVVVVAYLTLDGV